MKSERRRICLLPGCFLKLYGTSPIERELHDQFEQTDSHFFRHGQKRQADEIKRHESAFSPSRYNDGSALEAARLSERTASRKDPCFQTASSAGNGQNIPAVFTDTLSYRSTGC